MKDHGGAASRKTIQPYPVNNQAEDRVLTIVLTPLTLIQVLEIFFLQNA